MSLYVVGRPDSSEYAAYAQAYVSEVEGDDIVTALSEQLIAFMSIFSQLDLNVAATYRYEPGKWTINEVVGHVADTERILAARTLRIARGDATPLPPFEQDDYIHTAEFNSRPLVSLLAEFESVRHATVQLFRGLPNAAWLRRGTVSGFSVTTRGLAFCIAGHEKYHARSLREKYVKTTYFNA